METSGSFFSVSAFTKTKIGTHSVHVSDDGWRNLLVGWLTFGIRMFPAKFTLTSVKQLHTDLLFKIIQLF